LTVPWEAIRLTGSARHRGNCPAISARTVASGTVIWSACIRTCVSVTSPDAGRNWISVGCAGYPASNT
jgi:hypothetical protein